MTKKYTCPMHPDIIRDAPGTCPKCNMDLVEVGEAVTKTEDKGLGPITWKSYLPLILIIGTLLFGSLIAALLESVSGTLLLYEWIRYFMAGCFLVFSGFKLVDLKGFAAGYSTYDLLAKKVFAYGYIYPFIELAFGISMLFNLPIPFLLVAEFVLMSFSGAGVFIKLIKKEKFQCVCLGTFLKVPLTYVTVIEDFGMAFLAGVLLLISVL